MLTGTIINALAILAGSAVGLGVHALAGRFSAVLGARGTRLGERLPDHHDAGHLPLRALCGHQRQPQGAEYPGGHPLHG